MKYALFLISFLLLACAQKVLVPLPNGVNPDPEKLSSLYEDERVRILVKTGAWDGYPSDLEGYLIPIFLEVENRSEGEIRIELEDIVLVDDRGHQLNALSPKDASELARGAPSVGVSVGVGFGTPHWGFGLWGPPYYYYDDVSDIVKKAFIEGKILPGRKVSGFLYFKDELEGAGRVELRLSYSSEGVVYDVTFPFEVRDGKGSADYGNKKDREGNSTASDR
jgi:hypothetical protein